MATRRRPGRTFAAVLAAVALLLATVPAGAAATGGKYDPYKPYVPSKNSKDKSKPRLTKVSLKPRAARAKVRRTLRFRLSEPARVTGEVLIHRPGARTRGGRCVKRTSLRRGRSCIRRVRVARLLAARAGRGTNRARLDLAQLAAGRYTLVLKATDAAGNVGALKRVVFRILD
jgi:hypothetical protein